MHQFQLIINQRNDVIHSTWFIGYGNDQTTDFSNASGYKHKRSKTGAGVKSFDVSPSHFDSLANQAEELAKLFLRLNGCFAFDHSISNNFKIDENGNVYSPADRA